VGGPSRIAASGKITRPAESAAGGATVECLVAPDALTLVQLRAGQPRLLSWPIPRSSEPDAIDDASNLSRPDPSEADQIDTEHQPTDLAVGPSTRYRHPLLSS
jgi:hypothetical protein